eukprot:PITA_28175
MITSLLEKKGGLRKLNRDGEFFIDFIDNARLVDVYPKHDGTVLESNILPSGGSDHWPISLMVEIPGKPRNKPFRFEKFWIEHPNFLTMVEKWWSEPLDEEGSKMFILQKKLKNIKLRLKDWNKTVFGNIFQEKEIIEQKLEQIHKDGVAGCRDEEACEQEKDLTQQWHNRCKQEESLWKQKSRILWLKEGEQNTKFFHRSAMDYRSTNKILELKNSEGEILKNHNEISALLSNHFGRIAQEPGINREAAIQ